MSALPWIVSALACVGWAHAWHARNEWRDRAFEELRRK